MAECDEIIRIKPYSSVILFTTCQIWTRLGLNLRCEGLMSNVPLKTLTNK